MLVLDTYVTPARDTRSPSRRGRSALGGLSLIGVVAAAIVAAGCTSEPEPRRDRARTVTVEIGGGPVQSGDRRRGAAPSPHRGEQPDVPGARSCNGAREETTGENLRAAEIAVRCLTNAVRREKGLRELRFNEQLARAAATRSADMATANHFGHYGPGNSSVRTAVRRAGWIPDNSSWLLGENIIWAGKGGATPANLVRHWLKSPKHRANILSKDFRQIGVGGVAAIPKQGADPGATFTQIFGVQGEAARKAQTS